MVGERFNKWTVLHFVEYRKERKYWACRCDCGKLGVVAGTALRADRSMQCKWCACAEAKTTHGYARGPGKRRPVYWVWAGIRQLCDNKKRRSYKDYGERAIKVCDRWQTFENFLADMGEPPEGYQIDRIDNDGDFEPDNCRWVTPKQNMNNRWRHADLLKLIDRMKTEWEKDGKM